jgi:hypothetical protein
VANKKVGVGMTPEQVRASWGKPERINMTINADGKVEQ